MQNFSQIGPASLEKVGPEEKKKKKEEEEEEEKMSHFSIMLRLITLARLNRFD